VLGKGKNVLGSTAKKEGLRKMEEPNRIKKKMDNKISRAFWESFPGPEISKPVALPFIGDSWWLAETELSPGFLSRKD